MLTYDLGLRESTRVVENLDICTGERMRKLISENFPQEGSSYVEDHAGPLQAAAGRVGRGRQCKSENARCG